MQVPEVPGGSGVGRPRAERDALPQLVLDNVKDVGLERSIGQVIPARVSFLMGNKAVLEMNGRFVLAESQVPMGAGDRLLVRPIDHGRGEGTLVAAAALGGALMGGGVAVIVGSSDRFNAVTAALGAAGAVGGVWMVERWMGSRPDAGRRISQRLTVTPQSLALTAARVPGSHSLVRFTF